MEGGVKFIEHYEPANDVCPFVLYRVCHFSYGTSLPDIIERTCEHSLWQTDFFWSWPILDGKMVCSVLWIFIKDLERQII